MTAPRYGFLKDPKFTGVKRQIDNMDSTERAILSSWMAKTTAEFANSEMANYLELIKLANTTEVGEKTLALKERKIGAYTEIREAELEAVHGKEGTLAKKRASKEKIASESATLSRDISKSKLDSSVGITEAQMDFEDDQILPSAIIGGAGVILSGVKAYVDDRDSKRLIAAFETEGKKWTEATGKIGFGGVTKKASVDDFEDIIAGFGGT